MGKCLRASFPLSAKTVCYPSQSTSAEPSCSFRGILHVKERVAIADRPGSFRSGVMVHRAEANGVQGNDQARSTPESDGFDVVKHWNEEKKCWLVHVIAQGGQNMMVEFRGRFETEREANDEVARVKKRSHPPGNHPEAPSTAAGPRPTQDEANATLFRPPERFRQSRSTRPHLHALTDDDLNVLRDLAARKVGEYEGVMFNIDGGNWNAQACGSSTGPFPTPHAAAWAAGEKQSIFPYGGWSGN